jgi:hypothetical protein
VPNLSRRAVLVLGAAAGTVAVLPGTASAHFGTGVPWTSVLRRSDYAVALRKTFSAVGSDGLRYRMTLVAVRNVTHVRVSGEHAFNLIFKPSGAVPPDGIYRLTSAHARPSTLFISAVGPHGNDRRVQALVDRSS